MPSAYEVQVVLLQKHFYNVFSEGVADSSVRVHPAVGQLVGVGPQEVADQPSVGHVSGAHDVAHLLQVVQFGRQASVHAEDLLIDQCGDG